MEEENAAPAPAPALITPAPEIEEEEAEPTFICHSCGEDKPEFPEKQTYIGLEYDREYY